MNNYYNCIMLWPLLYCWELIFKCMSILYIHLHIESSYDIENTYYKIFQVVWASIKRVMNYRLSITTYL